MATGPNPRILPDSAYVNGAILPTSYWSALDLAQYQGVRGDVGGTWNPATRMTIGGAGLWLCGPTVVNTPGTPAVLTSVGNSLEHGDGDYIELSPQPSHIYENSIGAKGIDRSFDTVSGSLIAPRWAWVSNDTLVQSSGGGSNYAQGARLVIPIDLHQGATLVSVTAYFQVSAGHTANPNPPASLPQLRVFQVDVFGNVTQLATNAALTGWVGGGFVSYTPVPASGTLWYDSGTVLNWQWTADAGVVVDNSRYRYFAEVVDEQGASALSGNAYLALRIDQSNVPDMRPQ
jgi:hypothetical protein